MAVARQGACLANGAAEETKMETPELDKLMRGADGDEGDVRDALCEAVGVRPTHSLSLIVAQWVMMGALCTKQRAPNRRIAIEMAGGAPPGKRHRTIGKHQRRQKK